MEASEMTPRERAEAVAGEWFGPDGIRMYEKFVSSLEAAILAAERAAFKRAAHDEEMIQRAASGIRELLCAEDGPWTYARANDNGTMTLDGDFDLADFARAAIRALASSGDGEDAAVK